MDARQAAKARLQAEIDVWDDLIAAQRIAQAEQQARIRRAWQAWQALKALEQAGEEEADGKTV